MMEACFASNKVEKLTISSPDGMGDMILRQPMIASFCAAGGILQILVPEAFLGLATMMFPQAACVGIPQGSRQSIWQAVREFDPQRFVICSYDWTAFDFSLLERFPRVPAIGLAGRASKDAKATLKWSGLPLTQAVEVDEWSHDLHKYELLAAATLDGSGRSEASPSLPSLDHVSGDIQGAFRRLEASGMKEGGFWVVCVASNDRTRYKNWSEEKWATTLSWFIERTGQSIVLSGTEDERSSCEKICEAIQCHEGKKSVQITNSAEFDVLIGLIQLSDGYAGRDTGTMHLAAALDKPVVALFGGGHWPRFTPLSSRSYAQSMDLPCRGCDWVCHFPEPYCVQMNSRELFLEGWIRISGKNAEKSVTLFLQKPTSEDIDRMIRNGFQSYRLLWWKEWVRKKDWKTVISSDLTVQRFLRCKQRIQSFSLREKMSAFIDKVKTRKQM